MDISTDTQVFQDIMAEFKMSPLLRYARLTVRVQDGIVTISGRVDTYAERSAAERAARRVAGMRKLVLEISAATMPVSVQPQKYTMRWE
jgi:osmotically-inducible protein OsmY